MITLHAINLLQKPRQDKPYMYKYILTLFLLICFDSKATTILYNCDLSGVDLYQNDRMAKTTPTPRNILIQYIIYDYDDSKNEFFFETRGYSDYKGRLKKSQHSFSSTILESSSPYGQTTGKFSINTITYESEFRTVYKIHDSTTSTSAYGKCTLGNSENTFRPIHTISYSNSDKAYSIQDLISQNPNWLQFDSTLFTISLRCKTVEGLIAKYLVRSVYRSDLNMAEKAQTNSQHFEKTYNVLNLKLRPTFDKLKSQEKSNNYMEVYLYYEGLIKNRPEQFQEFPPEIQSDHETCAQIVSSVNG